MLYPELAIIMDTTTKLKTGLVYSADFQKHITGPGHPERPERTEVVFASIQKAAYASQLVAIKPIPATQEDLLRCHTAGYIETAKRDVNSGAGLLSTGDTNISRDSYNTALLAAGGVISAIDQVCRGELKNAFCTVRPPGHHARPAGGMGFCLFDNIALGARFAQSRHGIKRVLIVDWDVHHGNGTQDIFYADDTVLFFDTHQSPLYPGTGDASETGAGKGIGFTMNFPVPAGTGGSAILDIYEKKLLPAARAFKPELVMISAGFDSRIGDPLGSMRLTDDDYVTMTKLIMKIADEFAHGKIVSVLEGGYSLDGLAKAATAHVGALAS
jgi:acetoin utilization deacetylase AcuC-like enzyme